MNNSTELMDDLIERQINTIRDDIPIGRVERNEAIDQLKTLYMTRVEEEKNKNQKLQQILTVASSMLIVGFQAFAYDHWFRQASVFEKTDSFTGTPRRLVDSILRPFNFKK